MFKIKITCELYDGQDTLLEAHGTIINLHPTLGNIFEIKRLFLSSITDRFNCLIDRWINLEYGEFKTIAETYLNEINSKE